MKINILDKLKRKNPEAEQSPNQVGQEKMAKGKEKELAPQTVAEQAKKAETKNERSFEQGLVSTKDIIAPSAVEVDFSHIRVGEIYYRTLFVAAYPRFVGLNWLSPLINFDASLSISMYIFPTDGKDVLDDLRRKVAEMEAEINTDIQRGRVVNPATQAKLEDALNLQRELVKGEERFFQFGLYVTISAESIERLNQINKNLEASLGSLMIISKRATLQAEEGFKTTLPLCNDVLNVTRNMDTTSLATTFPFVSSDLSDDKGIMYGINEHNGSLVIFDRFSMPNYNSVVFATSGAGKSYMIKLETMRSLMMGTDVIVIDPENEYKSLCEAMGGQYIAFGYGEDSKINPFDLTLAEEKGENALNTKVLSLHKMFKVMIGKMDPIEESILDKAVMAAYKAKGITPDPDSQKGEPPLIEDLYKSLIGMEDKKAQSLAARLEKYIKGSFAGIFNQKTTVDLKSNLVVFGIRNLEDSLRPVAMHIVLDYIWTMVKKNLKKRILVVDEAWYLMQHDDSAAFLRGIIKRGRKYFLATTTITQDVDDFLETPYGKEIVTNSAIQILLKQHSAAIDKVGEVFYLSEGEKQLLLAADKGEGIFFAGQNHVAIQVIASEEEHNLITSNPQDLIDQKKSVDRKMAEIKQKKTDKPEMEVQMRNEEFELEEKKPEVKAAELGSNMSKAETTATDLKVKVATPTPTNTPTPTPRVEPNKMGSDVAGKQITPTNTGVNKTGQQIPPAKTSSKGVNRTPTVNQNIKTDKLSSGGMNQVLPSEKKESPDAEKTGLKTEPLKSKEPVLTEVKNEAGKTTDVPKVEIKSAGIEADLEKRIKEMEEAEKRKMAEDKRKEEESKPKVAGKRVLFAGKGNDNRFAPPKVETVNPFGQKSNLMAGMNKPIFVNKTEEKKIPQPPQLAKKPAVQFVKKEEVKTSPSKPIGKVAPTGNPTAVKDDPGKEAIRPSEKTGVGVVKKEEAKITTSPAVKKDEKTDYDKLLGNG